MSTPAAAAASASCSDVTVCTTVVPAFCSARITSAPGRPKVKLTTGTGSDSRSSTFAPNASSSSTGSVGSVSPNRSASRCNAAA
jgi:hypothetical protein